MVRHRLTDKEWELIEDLFPPSQATGRPPSNPRDMLDGILWILRTGAPWRDLPREIGHWSTVWDYFDRWNHEGTLAAILHRLRAAYLAAGQINQELWMIDGTVVRAARCAGGGGKENDPEEPEDHGLGRSRGGFSTKIHIVCDSEGHPLGFHVTPGQDHESQSLEEVLTAADEVTDEEGEPIAWPLQLAGDKGYRAAWIDDYLLNLGIQPVIPCKKNEDRETRAVPFDREAYRQRNIVERLIGWLKESRRILTRFEKTAKNYCGMIKMAFIHRYLRFSPV